MILDTLDLDAAEFAHRTGWEIKPEGACRDDRCVPLPPMPDVAAGHVDVRVFAERLGMPLLYDEAHGVWSLGPEAGRSATWPRDARYARSCGDAPGGYVRRTPSHW